MKKQKTYSIRRRLVLLCIIPILAILSMMAAVYAYITATNEAHAWETFQSMAENTSVRLNSEMQQINSLFSMVGYNKNLQDYLINQTQAQKFERYELIQQNMQLMAETVPWVGNLYMRSEKWSIAHAQGGMERFAKMLIEYDLWTEQTVDGVLFTHPYAEKESQTTIYYTYALTNAQMLASTSAVRNNKLFLVAVQIELGRFLDVFTASDALHVIVCDGEVLESDEGVTEEQIALAESMEQAGILPADFHPGYYASADDIGQTGCRLVTIVDKEALQGGMGDFWLLAGYAISFVCAIIVLLMLFIMRGIMQPIMQLVRDMHTVINGAERVRPSFAEEMHILSDGINYMLANLQMAKQQEFEMRENMYQLQLQQTKAEMLAYRSQINPHFFFNTLECMCSMARYFKVKPMEELAEAMSKNFAYSLREGLYVPLEKEIQHVRNYMNIMDIRCPDKYQLRVKCAEETRNMQVLSLLLQPLVENAVSHGFRQYSRKAPCTIDMRTDVIENSGRQLRIRFTDNGCGMPKEELQRLNEQLRSDEPIGSRHIGLSNIRRRLKLAYGTSSHLRLYSREVCFLQIELIIPLKTEECGALQTNAAQMNTEDRMFAFRDEQDYS